MFNVSNKIILLAMHDLTLLSYATPLSLSTDVIGRLHIGALVLPAAHLLEVALCFRKMALHRGPLFNSVLSTLLFSFLHWKPLAGAAWQTH